MRQESTCRPADGRNGQPSPFLKWAGGKRWLAPILVPLLDEAPGRYFEPFLGGAAVFYRLEPRRSVLADINHDLINTYIAIREHPGEVASRLGKLAINHSEFLRMRHMRNSDPIDGAVRFLYLNRTAFNGLYRVNRRGEFNVPFGCKPGTRLSSESDLQRCAIALGNADLKAQDFRVTLRGVTGRDSVFVDPPYTVRRSDDRFKRYNERLFTWDDQVALSTACNELASSGARIVVTNAFSEEIASLYDQRLFTFWSAARSSRMAAKGEKRGTVTELLIVSRTIASIPFGTIQAEIEQLRESCADLNRARGR